MPYNTPGDGYETSARDNHVPLVQSEAIQEKLDEYERTVPDVEEIDVDGVLTPVDELADADREITTYIGVDGSYNEISVDDDHPTDKVGFLQTAAAKVDAKALHEPTDGRFVDPAALEAMIEPDKLQAVLPGANVVGAKESSVRETWRKEIYELFSTLQVQDISFLETFKILMRYSSKTSGDRLRVKGCPNPTCDGPAMTSGFDDLAECPACGTTIYPTDSLRLHEKISEHGSNQGALRTLMLVLEHLTAVAYTIYLYYQDWDALAETMIFVDGQLAMFDVTAWLHDPLRNLYADVREQMIADGCGPPVVVGIEKSGTFVDHADDVAEKLEPGDILTLTDDYLENYVLSSGISDRGYGHNTYYGHRFIVKTASGRAHVITLPKRTDDGEVVTDPAAYQELPTVLYHLNEARTQLYEDGLIPVTLAHKEASIPARTGSRVLRVFAEEELGDAPERGTA
jgi:hypothetical protein